MNRAECIELNKNKFFVSDEVDEKKRRGAFSLIEMIIVISIIGILAGIIAIKFSGA